MTAQGNGAHGNGGGAARWEAWRRPLWVFVAMVLAMGVQLALQGRIVWCACGHLNLWAGDIWSAHNSQHVLDPYSFTHVLHGVLFCGILAWALPRLAVPWQFVGACALEALWEVVENTPFIIQRYREATIGLGYEGDSITNSVADLGCCAFGFWLARRLGLWRSAVVFVVTELVLLFWVRDNLTLNIWMLTVPVDAIKQWQMVH